jgi:hypothetical protein
LLIDRDENFSTSVLSEKLRWLAVLAGCSSAVFGPMAFGSPFLILGAVIQPRARTTGRWLMWLGSLFLSLVVIPFGTAAVFEDARHLGPDNWSFTIFPLFVLSTILVCWLDVALVMEGLRSKCNPWVPGSLDWLAKLPAEGMNLPPNILRRSPYRPLKCPASYMIDLLFHRPRQWHQLRRNSN